VLELGTARLPCEKARALLRKLRDLNLTSGPVAVGRRACVELAGCLSLDAPVEKGVRYRIHQSDGSTTLLELLWNEGALSVAVDDPKRRLEVPVTRDRQGRACAPKLGARVDPESSDTRALEHFLRRVVKTMFR